MALERAPRGWRLVGRYVLLAAVAFVVLFPIYTMLIASLKPGNRVLVRPLVPDSFTLEPFRKAWRTGRLGRYLLNSGVVAAVVTVCQLVTAVLSAYAFAFLRFRGRSVVFAVFLATLLVPAEVTLVVNRRTVDSLDWLNSYQGLAAPFLQVPAELRDAARMDGLGHLGFLREIAVPLVRPTLGALGLFSFLGSWNQYLWPSLVTTDNDMNTVQIGLRQLRGAAINEPNLVWAGTMLAALPIFLVLLFFQRQLVRGLTAGAVKG